MSVYYLYSYYTDAKEKIIEDQQVTPYIPEQKPWQIQGIPPPAQQVGRETFDPVADYQPRIAGMPETAPAYDELRKPVDFPRPQCVAKANTCNCYSQQATLLQDYPQELCFTFVKQGYFDATKPRVEHRAERREPARDAQRGATTGDVLKTSSPPKYHMRSDGVAIVADPLR